ncbi:hypothetical protein [Segatella buccae]|uniref:hypothetical protein n=1 Tax=Segatella buccae TaxID=28126 RepID=UPI003FD806B5
MLKPFRFPIATHSAPRQAVRGVVQSHCTARAWLSHHSCMGSARMVQGPCTNSTLPKRPPGGVSKRPQNL